jgi:hypothetical protein
VPVGPFHRPALDDKIRAARAALDTLVDEGLFVRERSAVMEIVSHHANVDAWMDYRARRPTTSPVDPKLLKRGRDLQRRLGGDELLVREHIRATRYLRRAYRWPAPA